MPDTPIFSPPTGVGGPPAGANGPAGGDGAGHIIDQQIERELHDSYLTYAMSTIMDRALPDVRDGLKPSQRRILVAMNDLNLAPGRKHIKCAKICGDTSGNYHPHGESVIYPTLVNMGQDWKTRVTLIDKQGNFGSIDGDPPAAMRYTEARMTHATVAMLADLKLDTVDFKPNYDDRLQEPMVLPGKFPNLLINGSSGIAVGMACSIPPHNPAEVCDAIIALIDDPSLSIERLMEIVPGPDFPTGGMIVGRRGIAEAYGTGRGKIALRGKVHVEESGGRTQVVIDEIPYQVVQNSLIEKIVEAAKEGRIPDIADVKNFSGKTHRTRIVVYLKRGADPGVVEKQLYEYTPLQSTFSVINIALVNNRPKALNLKQLIQCYIDHRAEVIRRRTEHLLREAKKNAHKLEGLIYAVCDIDEVIALIRGSATREEAIEKLTARQFRIAPDHRFAPQIPARLLQQAIRDEGAILTRVQAEAIGAMRLIQLVGLEIEKLVGEYAKLVQEIEGYERILGEEKLVYDIIRADAREMRDAFGSPRLTFIEDVDAEEFNIGDLITEHTAAVTISHHGYAKRSPIEIYREQGRGGRGIIGSDTKDDDFIEHIFVASTHDDLLCFTNTGRVFKMKVFQIPEMNRTAKGRAIVNLLELRAGERVVAFLNIQDFERSEDYLFFATAQGRVKRTALKDYRNVHRAGIIAITLNPGDRLIDVVHTTGNNDVLLATAMGMSIRFNENDARVMGRNAAGVKGIELKGRREVDQPDEQREAPSAPSEPSSREERSSRADERASPNGEPAPEGVAEGTGPAFEATARAPGVDVVVGLVRIDTTDETADLLTVTENGYGKRTSLREYLVKQTDGSTRPQSRGGKGRIDIKTTARNGPVVAVRAVNEADSLMFISQGGMLVRVAAKSISRIGRNTQGVRLVNLKEGDKLMAAARIADSAGGPGDDEPSVGDPGP